VDELDYFNYDLGTQAMRQYLDFLKYIRDHGQTKHDRTGVGTYSVFGYDMRFNLQDGFPLVTTKKIAIKSMIYELLWFIQGDTNIEFLDQHGVKIWHPWADAGGDLGPIYGKQWRAWQTAQGEAIDQLQQVIDNIQTNPDSRRLLICSWNVGELPYMALPPCHVMFQFYVAQGRLSCKLTQRSADAFIGVPFNIASYALLTHMVAHVCGLDVGEFIWSGGDCHIYHNHLEQVDKQLTREPYALPTLWFARHGQSIDDFTYNDIQIINYNHHPAIKAPVAV